MLIYTRDKLIKGNDLFGKYVELLYPLKQKNITGAKLLLNILWGALCKKNKISCKINNNEITTDDHPNETKDIQEIIPISDTQTIIKFTTDKCIYDTKFARIKPFLLSKARVKIGEAIYPIIDHVYYSHTDSIISDIPLNLPIIGDNIGDLRFEGTCDNCYIINCTKKSKKDSFKLI
jgi:hypothetical protein